MFDARLGHYLTYHHPTQDFLRRHRDKFDGLIIPLSIATTFQQGTGEFALTLKKPYAIDPRTPIFQAEFERRHLRLAHEAMAVVHGPSIYDVFASRPSRPSDFNRKAIQEMAVQVLAFQKEFAQQSAQKVEKYAELLGEEWRGPARGPAFLIPPYFRSGSRDDAWYTVTLELAQAAARQKENYSLAAVIHISHNFPENQIGSVIRDYSENGFDGLMIFINDLQEYGAEREILAKYASFVAALQETKKPLFGLFGGYFTLLLRKIGLGCFSNAVGYGEYRDSGYHAGGQAVKRYYMPRLHRYFTDTEAQSILNTVNERWVRCSCNICSGKRRVTDLSSQQLLDHFLNTRMQELENARVNVLGILLDELSDTAARLSRHPALPTHSYQHLQEWTGALAPFC